MDIILINAAEEGNIQRVRELIDLNFIDAKDIALRSAAANGHTQIVELLLTAGANVHSLNDYSLRWAAYIGHTQVVELLLAAKANIHAEKDEALRWAAENGHTQIVELLIAAKANIHAKKDKALRTAAENGHIQTVELLIVAGANIEVLSLYDQQRFKHLIPIYISIQEYLMLELFIIKILELKDRFIIDVVPNKKYVILK